MAITEVPVQVHVEKLGLGYCHLCCGERIMAESKAIESGLTTRDEIDSQSNWAAEMKLPDDEESLPEVYPGVTTAPLWVSNTIHIGIGQMQQMHACIAVPVCRQRHLGVQSALAT